MCIAVIGDVVNSRQIEQRATAQKRLQLLLAFLNDAFHGSILAPFSLSRGDEIQALVLRAAIVPDVVWEVGVRFPQSPIRFGFGLGQLSTPLAPIPMETDGPAWWAARSAVESAAATRRNGGVWQGFGEADKVLTAFGTLLGHMRGRLTPRQRAVLEQLRSGGEMVQVAERLKISKQAVSGIVAAAGWRAYQEGEAAWRSLLNEYDYADGWGHARV
jgi:hypothetical protein